MTIKSLFDSFIAHKEAGWTMRWHNVTLLYDFIVKHPIKKVLDMGTGLGLSSSVIALAFKDKGEKEGKIDTVEQFDKCVRLAEKMIPKELKDCIAIYKSEAKMWQDSSIPYQYFSVYDSLPEGDYDLIINDGPAFYLENEKLLDFPNGTINKMLLERKLKKGQLIAFDGRIQSLQLLERYYANNFLMYQLAPKGTEFNVLEVKDAEPKFHDDRLDLIRSSGYFDDEKDIVSKK